MYQASHEQAEVLSTVYLVLFNSSSSYGIEYVNKLTTPSACSLAR